MRARVRLLVLLLGASAPTALRAQDMSPLPFPIPISISAPTQTNSAIPDRRTGSEWFSEKASWGDTLQTGVEDPSAISLFPPPVAVPVTADTGGHIGVLVGAIPPLPVALSRTGESSLAQQDTVRRRPRAVVYSDGYGTRLKIHRTLSWAMLPLFAASYFSGDQLLKEGSEAPAWARRLHPVAATSTAVLFGANAVTGTWNLWEGRHDPNGRTRRFLHGALFLAASGGFTYAGTRLADEAEQSDAKRRQHRNVNLASMGVSTASWLIMLIGN